MTCNLKGGPKASFLSSGLSVKCRDLSTRSSHSRYSYAKIKVSLEDGEKIAKEASEWEPVIITIDEIVQDRYIYPPKTLEIGHKEAWFKIYDARKILDRGVLSNHFDEVKLEEVMNYIMDNRDDPNGAITGWKAVTGDVMQKEVQTLEQDWNEILNGKDAEQATGLSKFITDTLATFTKHAEFMTGAGQGTLVNTYSGLTLEDDSPNSAIQKLEDTFSLDTWVDKDGILYIGKTEMAPRSSHLITGASSDTDYSMKEYNVTRGASSISGVRLTGKPTTSTETGGFLFNLANPESPTMLYPIAEAFIVDSAGELADGPVATPEEPVDIYELATLEEAARNYLQQSFYQYRNGSIIFNGTQSDNMESLAKMAVGDRIVVGEAISKHCNTKADGGAYGVKEVQHKISPRQGWKITTEVVQLAPPIESTSVYYDPEEDSEYIDMSTYQTTIDFSGLTDPINLIFD